MSMGPGSVSRLLIMDSGSLVARLSTWFWTNAASQDVLDRLVVRALEHLGDAFDVALRVHASVEKIRGHASVLKPLPNVGRRVHVLQPGQQLVDLSLSLRCSSHRFAGVLLRRLSERDDDEQQNATEGPDDG